MKKHTKNSNDDIAADKLENEAATNVKNDQANKTEELVDDKNIDIEEMKSEEGLPSCETDIEQLEATIAEQKDQYLRLFSEFDNYRKRTTKERIELYKTASSEMIMELLSILDDFDRANKSFETATDCNSVKEGFELIHSKLINILTKKGLENMDSLGKEFDTDFHEAITEIPAPTKKLKSKVVDVVEKGYLLNGKVIRFAKVVVGK